MTYELSSIGPLVFKKKEVYGYHNLAIVQDDGIGRTEVHRYFLCKREKSHKFSEE